MSIPIKITVDWDKMKVCEECGKRLASELLKYVRQGSATLDIPKLLCNECWEWNISNGGIRADIDPRVIRR